MQEEALEEINLKPKVKALRLHKSNEARQRRTDLKAVRETRTTNEHNKLRRLRKKNK